MPKEFNRKMYLQTFGAKLRSLRLSRNINVAVVVREVKISPAELILAEKGRADLYADKLASLCMFYGADPSEMLKGLPGFDD
ncbi:helix-turn-helix domain-containing protein [Fulvivirgaceae bacterium PWU4]|uniref:Helix-turn-helix domain-containing protein n=1 Tax=Chryseosolibacter histidini TaxID=2782349 RepID=A0AAP2DN85_9BACT|nr:helix-turn-helix transcriptional regulator [Chryseosolibacter histidini]MBT1699470.1 helix-turn-helix domain-containing protein [Chryseosolibacter histidini]